MRLVTTYMNGHLETASIISNLKLVHQTKQSLVNQKLSNDEPI